MLSNKLNLPEPIERAANRAVYSKGNARYSVTELDKPPRLGALARYYGDAIVEDVADHMASLTGRMWHTLFEQAGAPVTGAILEERLYADFDVGDPFGIVRISGAMDHTLLNSDGTLDDYKTTNVGTVMRALATPKAEWVAQLNIYKLLRHLHGQQISRLRIIAYMRDWFIARAFDSIAKGGNYPPHEIAVIDLPMWGIPETIEYVKQRILLHCHADLQVEEDGPERLAIQCTDEERWKADDVWALMKPNRKTAVKLYPTEAEARYAQTQTATSYIEFRPGARKRCMYWCAVGRAGLCAQWEAEKAAGVNNTANDIDTSAFD